MSRLWLLFNIIFYFSLFMDTSTSSNVTSVIPTPAQAPLVTIQSESSAASSAAASTGPSARQSGNKAKSSAKANAKAITNVIIENRDTQTPLQQYREVLTKALNQITRDIIKIKIMYKLINRTEVAYRNLMSTCGGKSNSASQSG